MEDFEEDIKGIKEELGKLYNKVVTHEAEAVIELLFERLDLAKEMYINR